MILDIYMLFCQSCLPTELILIIMSMLCITNIKSRLSMNGINFVEFCKLLKTTNSVMSGKFILDCLSNIDTFRRRNIKIYIDYSNFYTVNFFLQPATTLNTSYYNGAVIYPREYFGTTKYYVNDMNLLIISMKTDMPNTEINPILQEIERSYRDIMKTPKDYVILSQHMPTDRIIFDGNSIDIENLHEIIFKRIAFDRINSILPRDAMYGGENRVACVFNDWNLHRVYLGKYIYMSQQIQKLYNHLQNGHFILTDARAIGKMYYIVSSVKKHCDKYIDRGYIFY